MRSQQSVSSGHLRFAGMLGRVGINRLFGRGEHSSGAEGSYVRLKEPGERDGVQGGRLSQWWQEKNRTSRVKWLLIGGTAASVVVAGGVLGILAGLGDLTPSGSGEEPAPSATTGAPEFEATLATFTGSVNSGKQSQAQYFFKYGTSDFPEEFQ